MRLEAWGLGAGRLYSATSLKSQALSAMTEPVLKAETSKVA